MAELVTIEGEQYKKRSPFGVWGLAIVTLSVYGFVWYYKVHDEARRFLRDGSIKPGLMTLSLIVPIWGWITFYQLGDRRIQEMQRRASGQPSISAVLGTILWVFVSATGMIYYQSELNKVYEAARGGVQAMPPAPGSPPAMPPGPDSPPPIPSPPPG